VKDVRSFVEAIKLLKKEFNCSVLFIHHAGKDTERGSRGSSALSAACDAYFRVTATDTTRAVAVQCVKMRDFEKRATPWTFEGRKLGPSLVFFPTTLATHAELTASQNVFDGRKIGAALIRMGACGRAKAVPTPVLAAELFPTNEKETPEERQAALGRHCKQLNTLASKGLKAYCAIEGNARHWFATDDAEEKTE
jgi:hypothetical protein